MKDTSFNKEAVMTEVETVITVYNCVVNTFRNQAFEADSDDLSMIFATMARAKAPYSSEGFAEVTAAISTAMRTDHIEGLIELSKSKEYITFLTNKNSVSVTFITEGPVNILPFTGPEIKDYPEVFKLWKSKCEEYNRQYRLDYNILTHYDGCTAMTGGQLTFNQAQLAYVELKAKNKI